MTTFIAAALVPLRAGVFCLVRFSLVVAVLGTLLALAWNPDATSDAVVVVVTLPVILAYLGSRIWSAIAHVRMPTQTAASVPSAVPRPMPTLAQRIWVYVLLYSIPTLGIALGSLLAVPCYYLLEVYWATTFGLLMAVTLFFVGLFALMTSLCALSPELRSLVFKVVQPVTARLFPQRAQQPPIASPS
jgi:hypothetical protein